jgi:hypothetical protein
VGPTDPLGGAGHRTAPVHELAYPGVGAQVVDGPAEEGLVQADPLGLGGVGRRAGAIAEADHAGLLPGHA